MNKKLSTNMLLKLIALSLFIFNINTTYSQSISSKAESKETQSRTLPVIFTISPASVVLPACSTNLIPFECKNLNNSPGFWYYRWTIGNGWNLSPGEYITTTNVFYLQPSSTSVTPSAVTVMPISNAIAQPTLVSYVYRAPYTSDATINGNTNLCPGSSQTFNISGLKNGEVVSWSVSNAAIATLNNSTNTQTTVSVSNTGNVNLIATITNSCNQTVVKTAVLHSGIPQFNGLESLSNQSGYNPSEPNISYSDGSCNVINIKPIFSATNISEYQWEKITQDVSWSTSNFSNNITLYPSCNKDFTFKVRAKNICGWSSWEEITYYMNRCTEECNTSNPITTSENFIISPNPVTQGELLGINVNHNAPWFTSTVVVDPNLNQGIWDNNGNQTITNYTPTVNISILNQFGNTVLSFPNTVLPTSLDVSSLPTGTYLVVIEYQGQIESNTIIKE